MRPAQTLLLGSILSAVATCVAAADSARSLSECHQNLIAAKYEAMRLGCDHDPPYQADELAYCQSLQPKLTKWVDDAKAKAASCDAELIESSAVYERLRTLALTGDPTAQSCYITGYFGGGAWDYKENHIDANQMEEFHELAPKFVDAGLERGDWRVVKFLTMRRFYVGSGMLLGAYPYGPDHPETTYRMEYLLMLGNQQDGEGLDARQVVDEWKPDERVSAEQIAKAQAWAHQMYEKHFKAAKDFGKDLCGTG